LHGNHFTDLVVAEILVDHPVLGKAGTRFVVLMTHSGSRKAGNLLEDTTPTWQTRNRGQQATRLKKRIMGSCCWTRLRARARLLQSNDPYGQLRTGEPLDSACAVCPERRPQFWNIGGVQNYHNFAWLENGLVVHRKGATPTGKGMIDLIAGPRRSACMTRRNSRSV